MAEESDFDREDFEDYGEETDVYESGDSGSKPQSGARDGSDIVRGIQDRNE